MKTVFDLVRFKGMRWAVGLQVRREGEETALVTVNPGGV